MSELSALWRKMKLRSCWIVTSLSNRQSSSALSGTDTPNPELNIGLTCGLSPITPSTSKCVTRKRKLGSKTHISILTDSSSVAMCTILTLIQSLFLILIEV
ncbi:hypothetical protein J6590_083773 [Homalodisca vitripennis]|nr:hypothetical protein J6590_093302 [Homalodisca vitripennis]KAG8319794.1 hypothetical protein J6590_083773 [Homalodisca vitripennis]